MLTTLSNLIFLLCLLTDEREEKRDDDDDEGTRKENATIVVVKAYRIMLFSSSFDDDDKRAYNKAYSFVVVLFPKERHFFSFRGSPLFNFSRFVKLYLGVFTNPKQNCALSFFLFWKNRGLLDTLIH
jgi:hypothetical protein